MEIKEIFEKGLSWYRGLSMWKKVAACLFLVVLAVVWVIYVVQQALGKNISPIVPTESDDAHSAVVNNVVVVSKAEQKRLEDALMVKKSEAMTEAQKRVYNAGKQREVRDLISNAKSFEEVDDIIKGLKQ
jgi:hypothetical protein